MSRSSRRMTRREFVGSAVAAVSAVAAAPAFLRGQNLNNKLNIADHRRRRPRRRQSEGRRFREHRRAVRREQHRTSRRLPRNIRRRRRSPISARSSTTPSDFDAVVVSTCEHTHAFATLLALDARQARLLREAADLQHLGGAHDPRGGGQGEGGHADGHPDPRRRQLPPRGRAGPERRDRRRCARRTSGSDAPGGCRARRRPSATRTSAFVTERPEAEPVPAGLDWDLWLGPGAGAAVQQRLFPRAEMVSLVGFRQRHDERSRQPLERPAVLGAEAPSAAHDRGQRPTAASRRSRRRR